MTVHVHAREVEGSSDAKKPQLSSAPSACPSFRTVFEQGIGLMTDLYDLSIVNAVRPEFEATYGKMSSWESGALTSASHLGAFTGQLVFGFLADRLGRRGTFIATAALMSFAALGAATVVPVGGYSAARIMIGWRFLLGIGIGGEYPLSGAVTAEKAPLAGSAVHLACMNLCFMAGQVLAPVTAMVCIYCGASAEVIWRVGLGGGSVLALLGFLVRSRNMQESAAWEEGRRMAKLNKVSTSSALWAVRKPLLGTVLVWFLYDVVSFGTGSYTTSLFVASTRFDTVRNVLFIVFLSVPGYFFTLWTGRFGRRNFQLAGYAGMAVLFLLMGSLYGQSTQALLIFVFGVQKTFDAFGPGAMTYMIPAEIFPSAIRASCHGLSSASGKLGAFVGTLLLPVYQETVGYPDVLRTCSALSVIGVLLTLTLTPPYDENTLKRVHELEASGGDFAKVPTLLWERPSARKKEGQLQEPFLCCA